MFNLNYRLLLLYKRFRKALLPCLLLLMALSSGAGQVPEFRVFTYRGGSLAQSQTFSSQLYYLDLATCNELPIVTTTPQITSAATSHQSTNNYAFSSGFELNPLAYFESNTFMYLSGTNWEIGNLGINTAYWDRDSSIHALASGLESIVYSGGHSLKAYSPMDGTEWDIGPFPPFVGQARSMTLREGELYMTTTENDLVRINRTAPEQSELLHSFPDSVGRIESMSTYPFACDSIVTYAFEHIGDDFGPSVLHVLDFTDYSLSPVCTIGYFITGTALPEEVIMPPCDLYADLDIDDSSSAGLDFAPAPSCRGPIPLTDTDLQVYGQIPIDSITLRLSGVLDSGQEYLQGSPAAPVTVAGNGGTVLTLQSNGATFASLEAALSALAYYNDTPAPTYGPRTVEIIVHASIYRGSPSYVYLQLDDDFLEVAAEVSPACFGQSDGMLALSAFNGEAPYTYAWSDGGSGASRAGLATGAYAYTLSDARGCTSADTLLVPENDSLWAQINAASDFVCGESGLLEGSATGGTAPYTYEWEGAFTGPVLENVGAGTYTLEVEDSLGCLAVTAYTLAGADTLFTFDTLTACAGAELAYEGQVYTTDTVRCDNSISSFGCDSIHCTSLVFRDTFRFAEAFTLCPGDALEWQNQTFTTDTALCLTYTSRYGCDSTHCLELRYERREGSLQADICPGGAYAFGGQLLTVPGTYRDTISDGQPCDSVVVLELGLHPEPALSISQSGSLCNGGSATLTGNGSGTFLWSDGTAGPALSTTSSGTYAVTLTDANGCTASDSLSLSENSIDFTFTLGYTGCPEPGAGQLRVDSIWGGMPPYSFQLNDGPVQPGPVFSNLSAQPYTITVADGSGCARARQAALPAATALQVSLPADTSIRLGQEVRLSAATNATSFDIAWDPPTGLSCTDCLVPLAHPPATTAYTATLTDSLGCTATARTTIYVDAAAAAYLPNAFSPNGDGRNDLLTVYAGTGVAEVLLMQDYNRWGGLVYEAQNFAPGSGGWDGTHKGAAAPWGVYLCRLRLLLLDGREVEIGGEVLLVR